MSEKNSSPPRFKILLVEDNVDDVLLTKHAFKNVPVAVDFQVARDGFEAITALRAEPRGKSPLPHIILLDLNLPRMDGRQLLVELKRDEFLNLIPVVILTTSAADDDVSNAYRNHASAYMTKPIDLREFTQRIARFVGFWLSDAATLPS